MRERPWGDTILAMFFSLALAAMALSLWGCLMDWAPAPAESGEAGGVDPAAAATGWSQPLFWPWFLGAVVSAAAGLLLLRKFRRDELLYRPRQPASDTRAGR